MDKHFMYQYSVMLFSSKRKDLLILRWLNLKNMLSEKSEEQNTAYYMIHYIKFSKRQNYRDRKY